jgi:DNA polymerase III alpha subunit
MIVGLTVEVDPEALAESITRESPSESVQESLSPEVSFKYSCGFADDIYVNGEELSREDRKKLCDEGLSLTLSEGENSYELLFKTGDSEYKESVVIKFDSAAYELRLQEQEEEEQRKAEAQRIAKDDAAREAQEEAQAKMLADAQAAKEKLEAELEEKRQTIGYAVSGISMKEIREEYDKQKDMSDYKADKYLESLSGTQIVWVGEVSDVDEYILGNGNYIALSLSDSLLDFDMAFVDVIQEEDKNLNRGTLIQVSGKISRIDQGILGLSVYIKETSIEVLR